MVIGIYDLITPIKFGDDRLRGLGLVLGQSSPFLIDFVGRPYNTLTLPCESVIGGFKIVSSSTDYRAVDFVHTD